MSLEALSRVDPKLARGALASTVLSLNGPGINDVPEQFRELSSAVLNEARLQLKIDLNDYSSEANEKIRSFLAKEISKRVYEGFDQRELTSRLGSEGKLSLGAYNIRPSKVFKDAFKSENFNFAARCVRGADLIQHLHDRGLEKGDDRGNSFSLFVSKQKTKKGKLYYVLISAAREGDILNVDALWRIFPDFVDLNESREPLDFFRAFANTYGLELSLRGVNTGKKWLENISVIDPTDVNISDSSTNREFVLEFMGERTDEGVRLRYAVAIDTARYRAETVKMV